MARNDPDCRSSLSNFNVFLNNEYNNNKHESTRFLAEELGELLESKGYKNIIGIEEV